MIETKTINNKESYFDGVNSTLDRIENNFWNDNPLANSVIEFTREECKEFKKEMREIVVAHKG